jgi:hypothetical protein
LIVSKEAQKQSAAVARQIYDLLVSYALVHPSLRLSLKQNAKRAPALNLSKIPAGATTDVVRALFGVALVNQLTRIDESISLSLGDVVSHRLLPRDADMVGVPSSQSEPSQSIHVELILPQRNSGLLVCFCN